MLTTIYGYCHDHFFVVYLIFQIHFKNLMYQVQNHVRRDDLWKRMLYGKQVYNITIFTDYLYCQSKYSGLSFKLGSTGSLKSHVIEGCGCRCGLS